MGFALVWDLSPWLLGRGKRNAHSREATNEPWASEKKRKNQVPTPAKGGSAKMRNAAPSLFSWIPFGESTIVGDLALQLNQDLALNSRFERGVIKVVDSPDANGLGTIHS